MLAGICRHRFFSLYKFNFGGLHLMNPTSFFCERLRETVITVIVICRAPRVVFSIGIAKMYFPELKIFEIVFG